MSIWKSIGSFFSSLFQKKESITTETVSTNDKQQEDAVVKEITEPIVIETDTDKDVTVEITEDVSDTNEVNVATVGYAVTTAGTTEDAFNSEGNYN